MDPSLISGALERSWTLWPGLCLRAEDLGKHAQLLSVSEHAMASHGHELALSLACGRGQDYAVGKLDSGFLIKVGRAVGRRLRMPSDFGDEVVQELRERLLLGPSPKLLSYSAQGSLEGWLLRAARNLGLRLVKRRAGVDQPLDIHDLAKAAPYPECIAVVAQKALDRALARLSERDRQLLGLRATGRSIDFLSETFGSHRATWARHLAVLIERIRHVAVKEFQAELGVSKVDAQIELARVALELSLRTPSGHGHENAAMGRSGTCSEARRQPNPPPG